MTRQSPNLMLSFINEIDDPIVQKDILDLNRRILLYKEGGMYEERFRSLRLARGVYGQRQPGAQMIRIKVPMGLLTFDQFRAILDVCDEYSTGKYHLTTRQDIQIHHVKLEDSPELWAKLELAISTDGKAPILAKRMREWLEDVLPEDVESNLDELQALRRELKGDFAQKTRHSQGVDPTFSGSASIVRKSNHNGATVEGASLSKFIRTSSRSTGQSLPSRGVAANRSTTSMPSTTRPNTVCSPSRWGAPPCRA